MDTPSQILFTSLGLMILGLAAKLIVHYRVRALRRPRRAPVAREARAD